MATQLLGDDSAPSRSNKGKTKKAVVSSTKPVVLSFPATPTSDPSSLTAPLRDESSGPAAISKACLLLNQGTGNGSTVNAVQDTDSLRHVQRLSHDPSYTREISQVLQVLSETVSAQTSTPPRSTRLLAAHTLARLARAAYAQCRSIPELFDRREPALHRLEDECSLEAGTTLLTAALVDATPNSNSVTPGAELPSDDGISSITLEALGYLCNPPDDELLQHLRSLTTSRVGPYAPSLKLVATEDPDIPSTELSVRVLESVVIPRLVPLVERVLQYKNSSDVMRALPVLVRAVLYHVSTKAPDVATVLQMDRSTYAKRWVDQDGTGLVDTMVRGLILPALQSHDGALAHTAATWGLRLVHSPAAASWSLVVSRAAVQVFEEELTQSTKTGLTTEARLQIIGLLLVALRRVPLSERLPSLILATEHIAKLPSTLPVPLGVSTPALQVQWQSYACFRHPIRLALWTELALSFFVDGPVDSAAGSDVSRSSVLKEFLSHPTIPHVLSESDPISCPRDELLLVFTTTAVDTGRRFRVRPDGTLNMNDPRTDPSYEEWRGLVWVVLTSFVSCVLTGPKSVYLEEDLSLITAGLASYVQLVQEYLHGVGLLQPSCSAAVKLTTNACPPHIVWDRMMDSAALLAKFEPTDCGVLDQTTKLMDELVAREKKQGIPSHHMRLFVLAIAADHWVQGRIAAIKSQFDTTTTSKGTTFSLNVNSGREIILAMSPKRLLAKVFAAHVPPTTADGKTKRDPIKKLAMETVKTCVACIENIALAAIDWRRRFGGNAAQETKHLVSAAVGVLQGKLDETKADEIMVSIMKPLCDEAVGRIQTHYEKEGSVDISGKDPAQFFPLSELVTQPVKTKIKPLISSTKPPPCPRDEFMKGYMMQLSRQIVSTRTQQAVDARGENSRPGHNWFRLSVLPIPESRDGQQAVTSSPLARWEGGSVAMASAASDAAQIVLAYSPERVLRYDGQEEYRLSVWMRVWNMTALPWSEGLRLELGVSATAAAEEEEEYTTGEPQQQEPKQLLNPDTSPLYSATAIGRSELGAGECWTWQVSFHHSISKASAVDLRPSVVYRNIAMEGNDVGAAWVGEGATEECKKGDDEEGEKTDSAASATENIRFCGSVLSVSPWMGFQPCPLVFFKDRWGDYEIFRFLWFRMAFHLPPVRLERSQTTPTNRDRMSQEIASLSTLTWPGEAIPGGFAARAWAFSTLSGDRVLCIYAEAETQSGSPSKQALYFRGDCESALNALTGSRKAKFAAVTAMCPNMVPV